MNDINFQIDGKPFDIGLEFTNIEAAIGHLLNAIAASEATEGTIECLKKAKESMREFKHINVNN